MIGPYNLEDLGIRPLFTLGSLVPSADVSPVCPYQSQIKFCRDLQVANMLLGLDILTLCVPVSHFLAIYGLDHLPVSSGLNNSLNRCYMMMHLFCLKVLIFLSLS